jgi:hypothetical protein
VGCELGTCLVAGPRKTQYSRSVRVLPGGMPLLVRALSHYSGLAGPAAAHPHGVAHAAAQAAGALRICIGGADSQATATAAGAIPAAVHALHNLSSEPVAIEQVCGVLRNVAAKHPANRAAVGAAGGVRALVAALAALTDSSGPSSAVEQVCGALWNAVADSPPNANEAATAGAVALLSRAQTAYHGTNAAATASSALAQLMALLPDA